MNAFQPRLSSFTASALGFAFLILTAPVMAAMAQAQLRGAETDAVPAMTWLWVIVFALMGWAASSLPSLAGWVDIDAAARLRNRLSILQGLIAAVLAGVCMFLIAKSSPQYLGMERVPPEMTVFVIVALAGFAGTKALQWVRDKFIAPAAIGGERA
jgi:hypothetical protein